MLEDGPQLLLRRLLQLLLRLGEVNVLVRDVLGALRGEGNASRSSAAREANMSAREEQSARSKPAAASAAQLLLLRCARTRNRRRRACCACSGMSATACLPTSPICVVWIRSSARRPAQRKRTDGEQRGQRRQEAAADGGRSEAGRQRMQSEHERSYVSRVQTASCLVRRCCWWRDLFS
jgi:hypothetical protein